MKKKEQMKTSKLPNRLPYYGLAEVVKTHVLFPDEHAEKLKAARRDRSKFASLET